jgi:hypothetical protein
MRWYARPNVTCALTRGAAQAACGGGCAGPGGPEAARAAKAAAARAAARLARHKAAGLDPSALAAAGHAEDAALLQARPSRARSAPVQPRELHRTTPHLTLPGLPSRPCPGQSYEATLAACDALDYADAIRGAARLLAHPDCAAAGDAIRAAWTHILVRRLTQLPPGFSRSSLSIPFIHSRRWMSSRTRARRSWRCCWRSRRTDASRRVLRIFAHFCAFLRIFAPSRTVPEY